MPTNKLLLFFLSYLGMRGKFFVLRHILLYVVVTIVSIGYGLCFLIGWDLSRFILIRKNQPIQKVIPVESDNPKEESGIVEV